MNVKGYQRIPKEGQIIEGHGGVVGVRGRVREGRWSVDVLTWELGWGGGFVCGINVGFRGEV